MSYYEQIAKAEAALAAAEAGEYDGPLGISPDQRAIRQALATVTAPGQGQFSRAQIAHMTPEQITQAHDLGRLDDVLTGKEN